MLATLLQGRSINEWLRLLYAALSSHGSLQRLVVIQWHQRQPRLIADFDGNEPTIAVDLPIVQIKSPLPFQEIMPLALGADMRTLILESSNQNCLVLPITLNRDHPTALCLCFHDDPDGELLTQLASLQRPLADTFVLMLELERLQQHRSRSVTRSPHTNIDLQPLIDNAPALIAIKDLNGNLLLVNRRFELLKGPDLDSLVGANLFKLFPKALASLYWHNDLEVLQQRRAMEFEESAEHVDGTIHTYLSMKFPLFDSNGEIWAIGVVANDISERKLAEQQQRESEQRLRVLLRHAPDAILIYDLDQQRYIDANRTAEKLFGLSRDALLALPSDALAPAMQSDGKNSEEQRALFLEQVKRGETPRFEWQYRHADGRMLHCETTLVSLPMGNRRIIRESLIDIGRYKATERQLREQEKRLVHMAHHDPLTGLPNRLLLYDRLSHSLEIARRHGNRVGLMLFDLDKFKEVNDRLGHDAGDQYLTAVSKRLRQPLRAMDTAARIGGDEFVVTVESIGVLEDLARVAQKLLEQISQPLLIGGQEFNPGLSIGISVFPDDAGDTETLLKHADIAMYRAKESGGNQFRFYTGVLGDFHRHAAQLDRDLHQAISHNQLKLVYQPVIELVTNKVVSMEALVRWHHPKRGVLVPADFLPLAEDNGTIWEIDRWTLEQLHSQWQQWRLQGGSVPRLSLNLSTYQAQQRQTLRALDDLLSEETAFATMLDLEMGEALLTDDSDETERLLRRLTGRGVSLTIDDFGCGCMSLSRLQQLPISRVKITANLINRLPDGRSESAMVCGILAMAHHLGIRCVAKGVELEAQRQFLLTQGCDEAQGHLVALPLPPAQCNPWLMASATFH